MTVFPRPSWIVTALTTTFLFGAPHTAHARPGNQAQSPQPSPSAAKGAINPAPTSVDITGHVNANSLDMFVTNQGSFGYDLTTGGPGLEYPRGTGKFALFAAGIWVGAQVNDTIRTSIAEYTQEYSPGPMYNGTFQSDQPGFKNYRLEAGNTTSDDYLNWPSPLPPIGQGAPLDSVGNPLLEGDLTLWSSYNDANPAQHDIVGPGDTKPLGLEIQQSSFAFNRSGPLQTIIFMRFRLINKGVNRLDSTFVSVWTDPDLGDYADDLVGCDTTLGLGYCYNETNTDAVYGSAPPAIGFDFFRGPIVLVSPGVYDTLGMTAFHRYLNGADPASPTEAYNVMQGLKPNGAPVYPYDDIYQPITKFQFSGDPTTGTGWLDAGGSDQRMQLSTGPFTMAVGDTQEVVCALIIGQGSDRLSSISDLKVSDAIAQAAFEFTPEPPTAVTAMLLESAAQPDRVRLVWRVQGAEVVTATVFRREEGGDWAFVGSPAWDGANRLSLEDATVRAGARYAYRLVVRDQLGEETPLDAWVDVPLEAAPQVASLRFAAANPSGGVVEIRYGLPTGGPARLDVYDVRGARIATLTNGPSTAGWHGMTWNGRDNHGRPVGSGVYLLRLETKSGAIVRKLTVAR